MSPLGIKPTILVFPTDPLDLSAKMTVVLLRLKLLQSSEVIGNPGAFQHS